MIDVYPDKYEPLLEEKKRFIETLFQEFEHPEPVLYRSSPSHFRERAEFKIWHEKGTLSYAMFNKGDKTPIKLKSFPRANKKISDLMPALLEKVKASEPLARKLFQIDFLTTLRGGTLVTLIYHKKLDETWEQAAIALKESLGIDLIGRARKQKVVFDNDYVIEKLNVADKEFRYQQVENSFTQPNAGVCEQMLSWAYQNSLNSEGDLLELYCGNGNFTIPLSQNFNQVLATEISKISVKSAHFNLEANHIKNVNIVRLSSEEITQALNHEREFRRLAHIKLDDYQFKTVFVDPPRCGLDDDTIKLVSRFDRIIYVSCNPNTLRENITKLPQHKIEKFALFDQFPYTDHIECGVILTKEKI